MKKKSQICLFIFLYLITLFCHASETTYRRILNNNPISLDLAKPEDINSAHLLNQIGTGLVGFSDHGIEPAIAKKWSISRDLKEYIFDLNPNACFSDGRKISVEDISYVFEYLLSYDSLSWKDLVIIKGSSDYLNGKAKSISGITKLSDDRIKITLNHVYPFFLEFLASPQMSILPKKSIQELNEYNVVPVVSSGPYFLFSYVKDKSVILKKNPYYYDHGQVYFDYVQYDIVKDKNQAIKAFLEMKYNDIWPYDIKDISQDIADDFKRIPEVAPRTTYLQFNLHQDIVNNINFRKFVASNLDVDGFLEELSLPTYYRTNRFIPRGMLGYQDIQFSPTYGVTETATVLLDRSKCTTQKPCVVELFFEMDQKAALEKLLKPISKYNDRVQIILKQMSREEWFNRYVKADYSLQYLMQAPLYLFDSKEYLSYLVDEKYYPGVNREKISTLLDASDDAIDKKTRSLIYSQIDDVFCQQYAAIPLYQGIVPYRYVKKGVVGYPKVVSSEDVLQIKNLRSGTDDVQN